LLQERADPAEGTIAVLIEKSKIDEALLDLSAEDGFLLRRVLVAQQAAEITPKTTVVCVISTVDREDDAGSVGLGSGYRAFECASNGGGQPLEILLRYINLAGEIAVL